MPHERRDTYELINRAVCIEKVIQVDSAMEFAKLAQ
jgi:hypothetical protein